MNTYKQYLNNIEVSLTNLWINLVFRGKTLDGPNFITRIHKHTLHTYIWIIQ